MWVRALSIAVPDSLPRILNLAEKMAITDLYIQVVISGSAYYPSDYLPRSQYLTKQAPADYSPLDSIIRYGRKKNIRVHAWINTFLVWSLDSPPDSSRHIYHSHPEWFLTDVQGRSMAEYSASEWKDYGLEGIFINPAHPEVRNFLKNIALEITDKFPVDGLHFDFIRYPGTLWGIEDTFRAALVAGYTNRDMRWLTLLRYPKLELFNRWVVYNIFLENKKRAIAIRDCLRAIKDALKNKVPISCAVFAYPSRAGYQYAQNWWEWQELIDYPVVMSYTPDFELFKRFMDDALFRFPETIMGIGFLWRGMENVAKSEITYVQKSAGLGIAFFDFAALDTMADLELLLDTTSLAEISVSKTEENAETTTFFKETPLSVWAEEGKKFIKYGADLDFGRFLLNLSLNPDEDLKKMGIDRQEFLNRVSADVAAFEYLNHNLLSMPEKFDEPPHRVIEYTYLRWNADSAAIRSEAKKIKKFNTIKRIYPEAMNPLTRSVFEARKGEIKSLETRTGIYVFRVKEIKEGKRIIPRKKIPPGLFSIYLYWTLKNRFDALYQK